MTFCSLGTQYWIQGGTCLWNSLWTGGMLGFSGCKVSNKPSGKAKDSDGGTASFPAL